MFSVSCRALSTSFLNWEVLTLLFNSNLSSSLCKHIKDFLWFRLIRITIFLISLFIAGIFFVLLTKPDLGALMRML